VTGTLNGIDTSHFQDGDGPRHPLVDWDEVLSDQRIRVIMVKATQTAADPEFAYNWATLRHLVPAPTGRPGAPLLMAYHFHTMQDPQVQANTFKKVVGELRPGEGVMIDFEVVKDKNGNVIITAGTPAQQAALLAEVEKAFGRFPLRYSGDTSPDPLTERWPRHIARYRPEPPDHECCVWQWGGSIVPGIAGPVDSNQVNDWPTLFRCCGLAPEEDMTAEESKMLKEVWTLMTQGYPAYGTKPVGTEVSRIGRMVDKIDLQTKPKP
jgi:GH25 family lysozyme M1 (1,4-beta-N-acetylmuramidase)